MVCPSCAFFASVPVLFGLLFVWLSVVCSFVGSHTFCGLCKWFHDYLSTSLQTCHTSRNLSSETPASTFFDFKIGRNTSPWQRGNDTNLRMASPEIAHAINFTMLFFSSAYSFFGWLGSTSNGHWPLRGTRGTGSCLSRLSSTGHHICVDQCGTTKTPTQPSR